MTNLNIIVSNKLEILSEKLAERVKEPLSTNNSLPFRSRVLIPETIIIQSRGMERWISMEIARHNGICANCRFPFPNHFWKELSQSLMPDLIEKTIFDPDILKFKLMKIIPACKDRKGFEDIKKYLQDDFNGIMLYQLCGRIADLFDQYLVFRPEMMFSWEDGKENHWQAHLWRLLVKESNGMHRARIQRDIIEKIGHQAIDLSFLPNRISIFGISYLPPYYLKTFTELSRIVQIDFYVMNPCREYWSDIVTESESRRIRRKYSIKEIEDEDLHLEKGNRLLSSMGVMGRDFFHQIVDENCQIEDYFQEVESRTMLESIQSDILNLKDRPVHASCVDDTLQVHSCHSPLREVEILYDRLLSLFEEDTDLRPNDVIVMTPDIQTYAPFMNAVFGSTADESVRIPFSIADQSMKQENRIIDGFMALLELKGSRFGVNQIISLLDYTGVKENFGFTDNDAADIQRWAEETNIRWGIDADFRTKQDMPAYGENTWKAGFDRMLLGYAMPGYEKDMFAGILSYDNIEGQRAEALGTFMRFFHNAVQCAALLETPRSLSEWRETLLFLMETFFDINDETERDLQMLRRILYELGVIENTSKFNDKIEFEIIESYLSQQFKQNYFGSGFISKGVTFCAMLPMRSIPFQVVCLIGINADTFPRNDQSLGFDLMAKNPRPGDRSSRNDDKYLFLESIISARKKLHISYIGQSIYDNSKIPPSSVVSELIDYIREGFAISEENLIIQHRRHPFHPDYFNGGNGPHFTYSMENLCAGEGLLLRNSSEIKPFISKKLTEPEESLKTIDIRDLCAFFKNPAKYLVEKRLGIYLTTDKTHLNESENFDLDYLERYLIAQDLMERRLSGCEMDTLIEVQKAKGVFPIGNPGEMIRNQLATDVEFFARKYESLYQEDSLKRLQVHMEVDGFLIQGILKNIRTSYMVCMRYAKAKPRDFLNAWICHLILCEQNLDAYPQKTILVCRDETYEFLPVPNTHEILTTLLKYYWDGLQAPLKFFPESSFEYAKNEFKNEDDSYGGIRKALHKWINEYGDVGGESEDPYFKLCFGKIRTDELFDTVFSHVARDIFSPIFSCRKKVSYLDGFIRK